MAHHTAHARKKVVIVGGGFAGVSLARLLGRKHDVDVELISDSDTFRYYPALYASATGHTKIESSIPLPFLLFDAPRVGLTRKKITSIDADKHELTAEDGTKISYDIAVLALGVVTSYFGIKGLEEYSYGIKSIEEVTRLRDHLHDELVRAGRLEHRHVIVGAGPTGIELAAELVSYLRRIAQQHGFPHEKITIDLIEAAPHILPRMTTRTARLVEQRLRSLGVNLMTGKTVQAESATSLLVDGKSLPAETVVWTAGVTNNPFFAANAGQFKFDERHKVVVDDHFMAAKDIFVLGDNASRPYSGLAQTAVHDAHFMARYITAKARGNRLPTARVIRPISVIPVGHDWAVIEYGKLAIGGWLGGLLRKAADFIGYYDVASFFMALTLWTANRSQQEDCPICRQS